MKWRVLVNTYDAPNLENVIGPTDEGWSWSGDKGRSYYFEDKKGLCCHTKSERCRVGKHEDYVELTHDQAITYWKTGIFPGQAVESYPIY